MTGGNGQWMLYNVENHTCPAGGNHVRKNAGARCRCGGCGAWFADLSDSIRSKIKPKKSTRGPKPQESIQNHALKSYKEAS